MSLDVYLSGLSQDGKRSAFSVYSANITHNVGMMADQAGIYDCLWRPEEHNITRAKQLIEPLEKGICLLATQKARFEKFNATNGWGTWTNLLLFCASYLQACRDYPDAYVEVSR